MNNNVVLKAVGLQKSYKEGGRLLHVLKDVNLEVHEGESVAIVGTSGSGKTTLLQCIGGLDRFDKGLIEIGGENIAELSEQRLTELRNRKLGFVYQFHHLLPEFRALVNNPQVIVADEPTGNLDGETAEVVIGYLLKLSFSQGLALVIVTHDPDIAARCDRVVRLKNGCILPEEN